MTESILARLDGPLLRAQRELLLRLARHAKNHEAYTPSAADQALLEGLIHLTDAIADEAHDRYGIKCLLI
jgi:hypothetical protein